MSQITTHVLDTSKGLPGAGIHISLQKPVGEESWETMYEGITNDDGRIPGFMPEGAVLAAGTYRMLFKTDSYFKSQGVSGFYPFVPVVFQINDEQHYHVPLLLNPFGYSTYRGS